MFPFIAFLLVLAAAMLAVGFVIGVRQHRRFIDNSLGLWLETVNYVIPADSRLGDRRRNSVVTITLYGDKAPLLEPGDEIITAEGWRYRVRAAPVAAKPERTSRAFADALGYGDTAFSVFVEPVSVSAEPQPIACAGTPRLRPGGTLTHVPASRKASKRLLDLLERGVLASLSTTQKAKV